MRSENHSGGSNDTNHGVNNVLLAQSSNASNDNLEIGSEGQNLELYMDTGSGTEDTKRSVDADITNDIWYHLVLTYSASTDQTKLYLDGQNIKSWNEWKSSLANSGSSPITIGLARPNVESWGDFEGNIADVRIYDYELDEGEVSELYGGIESVTYLDGLGRSIQTQELGGDKALINGTLYNDLGMPEVVSRPIEIANQSTYLSTLFDGTGAFSAGGALPSSSPIENYYQSLPSNDEDYAYSQTVYESSPLGRTLKSTLPGPAHKMGNGREVTSTYELNDSETFATLAHAGTPTKNWGVNTLQKTITEDPDGKQTITYTDGWGQTIVSGVDMNADGKLTRGSDDLVTEFSYDLLGNLVRSEDPRGLSTRYTYNELGHLTDRYLPDQTGSEQYKYDAYGNLRFVKKPFNKPTDIAIYSGTYFTYDNLDEQIVASYNGELSLDISVDFLQYGGYTLMILGPDNDVVYSHYFSSDGDIDINEQVGPGTYTLSGWPDSSNEPYYAVGGYYSFQPDQHFTYSKYDELGRIIDVGDYSGSISFNQADPDNANFPTSDYQSNIKYCYDGNHTRCSEGSNWPSPNNLNGQLSKINYRDLSSGSTDEWGSVLYSYNNSGFIERLHQDLPGGVIDTTNIYYEYDELGRATKTSYVEGSNTFYQWMTYDDFGRLETVYSNTADSKSTWVQEADYRYFADGSIQELNLGEQAQSVDYTYTVQGWLSDINDPNDLNEATGNYTNDKFGMSLRYYTRFTGGETPVASFSGNIAQTEWEQAEMGTSSNEPFYSYYYDNANRLDSAKFHDPSNSIDDNNGYDAEYTYDKNGNISSIKRFRGGPSAYPMHDIDNTVFSGNKLLSADYQRGPVPTSNATFGYDANGNMITNSILGLTNTSYDWRNLPKSITVNGNTLTYSYDHDGNRIKKAYSIGNDSYYMRGAGGQTMAVYDGSGELQFFNILAAGGIIGTYDDALRRYFIKDQLGSIRTTVDENGVVEGYDDYYPFGLGMPGRSYNSASSSTGVYKFTGHERDDEGWSIERELDYMMARNYDPVIGRFLSIDPLVDLYPDWSPYSYTFNNPIRFVDPTGACPEDGSPGKNQYGSGQCLGAVEVTAKRYEGNVQNVGGRWGALFFALLNHPLSSFGLESPTAKYRYFKVNNEFYAENIGIPATTGVVPLPGGLGKTGRVTQTVKSAYKELVERALKKYNGNVTISRDGKDLFRIHRTTSGHGFEVTQLKNNVAPNGITYENKLNVPVRRTHLRQLDRALKGDPRYGIRTKKDRPKN